MELGAIAEAVTASGAIAPTPTAPFASALEVTVAEPRAATPTAPLARALALMAPLASALPFAGQAIRRAADQGLAVVLVFADGKSTTLLPGSALDG
jgi:hypothetical protein